MRSLPGLCGVAVVVMAIGGLGPAADVPVASGVVAGTNGLLAIGVCGARGEGAPPSPGGICTLQADGSQLHQITNGVDSEPAWSPDGTRIAFVRLDAQSNSARVEVANADGSDVHALTDGPKDSAPAWSPAGDRLVFSQDGRIAVVGVGGGAVTNLTTGPRDYDPAWSPDGSQIAISSGVAPSAQIELMNASGGDRHALTTGMQPAWAPSGGQLAFTDSGTGGGSHIAVVAASGGAPHDLTTGAPDDSYSPAWSPDGTRIAFGRGADMENPGVWAMDADGTHATRLAGGYDPDWQATPAQGGCAPSVEVLSAPKKHATVVARATNGCFARNGSRYTYTGAAKINGLDVSSDSAMTIDTGTHRLSFSGPATITLGGIPLKVLDAGSAITFEPKLSFASVPGKLFGFGFSGPLKLTFDDHEGTAVEGAVSLSVFGDKIDAGLFLYTSTPDGLHLDGVRIRVTDAPVDPRYTAGRICNPNSKPFPSGWECVPDPRLRSGQGHWVVIGNAEARLSWLPVKELLIQYQQHGPHGSGEWTGKIVVQLTDIFPGVPADVVRLPTVEMAADFLTDPFKVYSISGQVADANVPVPFTEAVFLQDLGFGFNVDPLTIFGNVRVTMGPEVSGEAPLGISGTFKYKPGSGSGFDLVVTGALKAFKELDVANGSVDADLRDGGVKVTLAGNIGRDFGPVHLEAGMNGGLAFHPFHAQFGLTGTATLWGQGVTANGVVSDAGIGVCGRLDVLLFHGEIGFTHRWDDGTDFFTCDLSGLYTVAPPTSRAAADGRTVMLPAGLAHVELAAVGQDGPPALRLIGPGAEPIDSPAEPDRIELHQHVLALAETGARTTLFVLDHPAAGTWQIVPQEGAKAPVRYLRADPAVDPRIRAHVAGHGLHRTLTWSYVPQRGRTVAFEEQGPFTARMIATGARPTGHARFRPGTGPAGPRKIVALIYQDGLVRSSVVVARYRAPSQRLVGRVRRPTYRVAHHALTARWLPARHATSYELEVTAKGARGRLRARTPSRGHARGMTLALTARGRVRAVRVRALRNGIQGPWSTARRLRR